MSILYAFLTLLLAFFLETSFLGAFRIFDVVPNLILILLVIFAMFDNRVRVYAFAVFFGFILDLTVGMTFGIHMLLFVFAVAFAKAISKNNGGATPMPVVVSILSFVLVVYYLIQATYFYLTDGLLDLNVMIIFLSQFVVDMVLGVVIFLGFYRFFDFLKKTEKKYNERVKR